ncbi:MAG: PLP-dependent aminotransferase family protein [Prevotellaceae bacterium]|jgi:2-aminoadipate transaminase|nr:PLP-dependent aminotransferase family protein [Prevotellaceae bacterium]
MVANLKEFFSDSANNMKSSAIRELLKVSQQPEIISFAGGLPAPDLFPVEILKKIAAEVLDTDSALALQYGPTEGDRRLREIIVARYQREGIDAALKNVIITTASQQCIDIVSKLFLNPGDTVVCELPSYLAALQSFAAYRVHTAGVRRKSEMDAVVGKLVAEGRKPKFIYVIPDFQNPAGTTMSLDERKTVLDIAHRYDVLVVEDTPYRELRFEGEAYPSLCRLDGTGQVITLGTFSKIFVPGFRLGWLLAHEDIIAKAIVAKQSMDLCSPVFDQKITARFFDRNYFDDNLKKVTAAYHEKRDGMLAAFEKYMPRGVTWTRPQGGLFLFLTLPESMDAKDLFDLAIRENVAFVLGEAFHCDGSGKNTLRINFSYMSKERNEEGVRRLAKAIRQLMAEG